MLEIVDLAKRYGDVVALDGASFTARRGRLVGFLGPNGAGKTTAMRAIFGLIVPDRGETRWEGRPIVPAARLRFGYMPEQRGLYPRMRVHEQLVYFAQQHGLGGRAAAAAATRWLERLGLVDRARSKLEDLSHGNQQRVQLATALVHDPDLLVLDEPFSGLDPINVRLLKEAFLAMRDRGKTLVFSTHQMEQVEELCESIAIVDGGRVVVAGAVRDVKRDMNRRIVRLATDGDGRGNGRGSGRGLDWLGELPGVEVGAQRQDYLELTVPADLDPQRILRTAVERGERVARFEIADPSLEEVFVAHVGRRAVSDEEEHLAAGTAPPASGEPR